MPGHSTGAQTATDAASQFYNCADTIGHADRHKRTNLSAGAAGYTIFLINLRITLLIYRLTDKIYSNFS